MRSEDDALRGVVVNSAVLSGPPPAKFTSCLVHIVSLNPLVTDVVQIKIEIGLLVLNYDTLG